jgi:hypothetical protein
LTHFGPRVCIATRRPMVIPKSTTQEAEASDSGSINGRATQQHQRQIDPECLGNLEIDHQLEPGWTLDGQIIDFGTAGHQPCHDDRNGARNISCCNTRVPASPLVPTAPGLRPIISATFTRRRPGSPPYRKFILHRSDTKPLWRILEKQVSAGQDCARPAGPALRISGTSTTQTAKQTATTR